MARPTLRCGSVISAPLFVIVVKPLKARIDSATDATKPVAPASPPVASNDRPLAQSADTPNSAMPPTFSKAMTMETSPTERVPEAFTR